MNLRRRYVTRSSFTSVGLKTCVCAPVRLCTRTSVLSASGSATGLPYEPVTSVALLLR